MCERFEFPLFWSHVLIGKLVHMYELIRRVLNEIIRIAWVTVWNGTAGELTEASTLFTSCTLPCNKIESSDATDVKGMKVEGGRAVVREGDMLIDCQMNSDMRRWGIAGTEGIEGTFNVSRTERVGIPDANDVTA